MFEIVVTALLVGWLVDFRPSRSKCLSFPKWLVLGLFLLSLTNLLLFNRPTIFFGNQFRLQGVFTFWCLLLFSWFSGQIRSSKVPVIWPVLSLGGLVLSVFLWGQDVNSRAVGSLGEANALAGTAVFLWPFIFFKDYSFKKLVVFLATIATLALIFLSGSRSGLVAFVLEALTLFLIKTLRVNLWWVAGVTLVFFLASLSLPLFDRARMFESRTEVWQTALLAGLESPVIGQGFGKIEYALPVAAQKLSNNLRFQYVDSAHNIFLDYWVEGGVIGLVILVTLVFLALRKFVREKKGLELVLLLGLLEVLSFNPASIVVLIYFWWLIGQSYRETSRVN